MKPTYKFHDKVDFLGEIRGILICPNVIINCFINNTDYTLHYHLYLQAIKNIVASKESGIKFYMTEIDKSISRLYCEKLRDSIDENYYQMIDKFISNTTTSAISKNVTDCASYLKTVHPPDAIRLATAIEHGLALLTWEPQHFAQYPQEINALNMQGYTRLNIGVAEDVDSSGGIVTEDFGIWVFSVSKFSNLLSNFINETKPHKKFGFKYFRLKSYQLISSFDENSVDVIIHVLDREFHSSAIGDGPVDAIFSAIRKVILSVSDFPDHEIVFSVLDSLKKPEIIDSTEVQVSVQIEDRFYKRIEESKNLFRAAANAYLEIINSIIEEHEIKVNAHTLKSDVFIPPATSRL